MSYTSHLREPGPFAVPSLASKGKGDDFQHPFGGETCNGYTATEEGSAAPTAEVSEEKHSSSASSDCKKEDEKWIWVLDPMTRKLRVPLHLLVPTHATSTPGTVPSLCIAFLEGRCRHAWCRQAHVVPSAIPQLRYEALSSPTCCHFHQDPQDISMLTNHFKYVLITGNGGSNELIPADRVACTVGLRRYLVHNVPKKSTYASINAAGKRSVPDENDILELPAKFICRLHLAHRCRYLDDCNNIHICREFEVRLQPPPQILSSLNSVTTSTRTVNIGDTCYTVTPLAVGDVSDEDFNAIAEAKRINHRNASTPASATFKSAIPPYDAALGSSSENGSPMPYSAAGGAFPTFPDYRGALRTPNTSAVTPSAGQSPAFLNAESPSQIPPGGFGFGGHLRVYDVRPKNQSGTVTPSCTNSPAMNPNAQEKNGAGGKIAPPKYTDGAFPTAMASRSNGVSGSGCASSRTEGGISLATSEANTPLATGGYSIISGRTAVTTRK
ncbi:conserved hypothetical protein [Leishmania mexicana MHOM/GT/2001/U1103]|uniref:C3H1-type domain-containing protein n=1 Tax=Leishmania mexicana (strain MHOM/GT/2001/U1103) TaxID=929439 RepID=E9AV45_LEIMU|nr:conserved hypothetical protein [Leishmania mexicana MHOM/GT/2001/U1103]CBZ26826.1 conserved hypothetical protein [Leishmania mexicana MHOM/GT/2001/U1103]